MGFVTIYTFYKPPFSGHGLGTLVNVIRSDEDPTYINYNETSAASGPFQPPPDVPIQVSCFGVDQYTYYTQALIPYAYYGKLANSPTCGYVPPTCDIMEKTFNVTDETATGANDGTINLFVTTSYAPVTYYLNNPDLSIHINNTTGYFTGLPPNTYTIAAVDANGCQVLETAVVNPFDDVTKTHFKYRLQYPDVLKRNNWELRLYDMKHNYEIADYPVDVIGTDQPVVIKVDNPDEDKTKVILSKELSINLIYDGLTFNPDEFKTLERVWYVELLMNGNMEFKGWLLPDEMQDEYSDPTYPIQLKATDGLPSLKGNIWGNGSGGNGYSDSQVQQYGLAKYLDLVKQCLDQLGYDYGQTTLISSLRYNDIYAYDMWIKLGTWSDILYNSSGEAMKTYDALDLLLGGMRLSIMQEKGRFMLINWSDLYYLNKPLSAAEMDKAMYEFDGVFGSVPVYGSAVVKPVINQVGFEKPIIPINRPQYKLLDKAYNIKASVQFNILALLYPNPSFEIGSIEGALPSGFEKFGTADIYTHYWPTNPTTGLSGAYDGNWTLRSTGPYSSGVNDADNNFITLIDRVPINQPNKKLNFSIAWKPQPVPGYDDIINVIPLFLLGFTGASGTFYTYDLLDSTPGVWKAAPPANAYQFGPIGTIISDYNAWNNYSITTGSVFPENGQGSLNIRVYAGGWQRKTDDDPPAGTPLTVDLDDMNITITDANDVYTLVTGEVHKMTAVTGIPQANLKEIELNLFTYPTNTRVAGNIFTTHDYSTGEVQNLWDFALKAQDIKDRLAATITRSIARAYQRPMIIWEGDIQCAYVSFYSMFVVKYYEDLIFMPFQVEYDTRNNTGHLILCEVDDTEAQDVYKYIPVFDRSARKNGG